MVGSSRVCSIGSHLGFALQTSIQQPVTLAQTFIVDVTQWLQINYQLKAQTEQEKVQGKWSFPHLSIQVNYQTVLSGNGCCLSMLQICMDYKGPRRM